MLLAPPKSNYHQIEAIFFFATSLNQLSAPVYNLPRITTMHLLLTSSTECVDEYLTSNYQLTTQPCYNPRLLVNMHQWIIISFDTDTFSGQKDCLFNLSSK